ncbi:MAG: SDR family NAD(P)-dependent oxidoreductase [Sorangiineae bacterium]|nr:SDR family NAD(P)-dependent oxidoreductase [Polyangiaceae bacterium]MEB2322326.1 SDR family NAD(P)-dependent oxidoreductase [Sorangiineae bacterium]
MTTTPLEPRSVLLTGAGRGIGRAVALELAEHTRMRLVLVSKSERALDTAAACNALRPGSAEGFAWDLVEPGAHSQGAAALGALAALPGPIALVHAAAELGPTGEFASVELEAWWRAMHTNLFAAVRLVRELLPRMLAEHAGRVVLFAGGGAAYGYPGFSSYGTAKAALVRFTETLALELGERGPIVTILAPGANETELLAQVRAAGGEVKTTVDIAEPCRAVRRLLTEDTRALNGRFLHVRDEWTADGARSFTKELYTLRRVEPPRR